MATITGFDNKDDTLQGTDLDDTISGLGGDDTLTGLNGHDTLEGGEGNDFLQATGGNKVTVSDKFASDTVNGGNGDDTLVVDYDGFISEGTNQAFNIFVDISTGSGTVGLDIYLGEAFTSIERLDFTGFSGNDVAIGGAMNDSFDMQGGNDTVKGGGGNDIITVGAGTFDIDGGAGNDILSLFFGNETADYIIDGTAGTVSNGGKFKNIETLGVSGGSGNDTIIGLATNPSQFAAALSGGGGNDTITGGDGIDKISGGSGNDILIGGNGNDFLYGGTGKDNVNAGEGNDWVEVDTSFELVAGETYDGGIGNDDWFVVDVFGNADLSAVTIINFEQLRVNNFPLADYTFKMTSTQLSQFDSVFLDVNAGDATIELTDNGAVTFGSGVLDLGSVKLANGGQIFDLSASSGTRMLPGLIGGDGADVVTGPGFGGTAAYSGFKASLGGGNDTFTSTSTSTNNILGEQGDDTLTGGAGNDTLNGGSGADKLNGGAGVNTVSYTTDTTGVTVNLATQTASGGDAKGDTIANFQNITGGSKNDVLTGDDTDNVLDGQSGDDIIDGAGGNDTIRGDISFNSTGADKLSGGDGDDTIFGYSGNDILLGGNGNDVLAGDTLASGAGDDTLDGGAGDDTLSGGAANDTFVYDGRGADKITDFAGGVGIKDVIKVTDVYTTFAQIQANTTIVNAGKDTQIDFGGGNKLTLVNFKAGLEADDFVFSGTTDSTPPTITNVASTPNTGSVGTGQPIVIDLTVSEDVTVVGTPTLALNDKGIATYDAINSTATDLKFNYTPTVGQNTADLQVSALVLGKGSTIKDLAGNALNLTGAKADLQLVVDTIAPIVKGALKSDTGISATDKFTTDATLTGSGDPNATVNFTGDVVGNTVANSAGVWTFSPGVLADGAHSITATETDAAGNVGSTTLQFTLDSKAPTVTGSLASPTSIGTGGTATITVNLGEAISVVGTPTLILSDGETATYSAAASKLAAGALAFTLKAAAGTNQSDLSIDHVNLAAGVTVKDLAGNAADFSKAAGADLSLSIDTVAPTITSVTTPSTGAVGIGQTVEIDILTSEAVNVVGTPTLALNDKGIATYDAINSTATDLKFNYTPTVGQNTVDLQVSALVLGKGSTIKDLAGNLLNPAGAAKADLGLVVDTLAPAVTKVAVLPASGALTAGNDVTITLTLNDKATVTSNPVLTLNDGATADYVSGSGSNTLVFNYHVGSESTTDLKITGINQSGGTIADAVGNLISSALLFDTKLTANVFTWTHTAAPGGDWNTGANWLPASVPVAGNTALITSKGTYTVTSNQDNSIGTLSLTNKTATLDVQGFEFDITGSSTNAGTIQIDNGAKLGLAGTFTNTGSVLLNSTGSATGLLISGATILAGTGKFTLSDNIGNGIFADGSPATLTNISNTIAGAGQIFDNDLSIDNQAKGIINAVGTSSLTIDVDTFTNAGTLKATGTGGLVIHDTTIANVGKGLVATLAANSHIDLDDADITGGTVTIFKNSSIDTINDHDSTISATKFTNAGAVMADHGDLTVTGAIANTGLLAAAHDSTLSFTGAVTGKGIAQISSGGTLEFQGASSALVTFLDGTGTLELDNATNSVAKFTGTVTGFANGTDIELGAIDFTTGNAQLSFNAGKLTVTDGTHSETLTFIGSYTLADFNAVNVGGHVDLLHV